MAEQAQGPLGGIKALDVTMNLSGPAAAKHLADFGADVIKVERPVDRARHERPNERDGKRPRPPTGAPICNVMTGMFGAMGVLTALHHRNRTGEGQFVDTSLFESGIAASFHQPSQ